MSSNFCPNLQCNKEILRDKAKCAKLIKWKAERNTTFGDVKLNYCFSQGWKAERCSHIWDFQDFRLFDSRRDQKECSLSLLQVIVSLQTDGNSKFTWYHFKSLFYIVSYWLIRLIFLFILIYILYIFDWLSRGYSI